MDKSHLNKYLVPLCLGMLLIGISYLSLWVNKPQHVFGILGGLLFILGLPWYIKNPQWMLYITIIFIPLGILAVVIPGMTAVPLLGFFLFLLCIPHFLFGKITIPPLNHLYKLFICLSCLMIISSLMGINFSGSFKYLKSILQMIVFAFLIICLVNSPKRLNTMWWMIVVSCFLAASITIASKYGFLPFSLDSLTYENIGVERQTGTDGDPNYFAAQLSVGFAFCFSALLYLKKKWKWIVIFPMAVVLLLGIGLTLSMGAIIGLMGMFMFHIIISKRLSLINKTVISLGLILLSICILMIPSVQVRVYEQVQRTKNYGIWQIGTYRVLMWSAGANIAIHHPLLGVGVGNHGALMEYYDPFGVMKLGLFEGTKPAHNMFISVAADNGIPTLIVFVWLIFYVLKKLFYLDQIDSKQKYIINAILSSLVCYLIQNMFLDGWRGKYLWVLIGMGGAIIVLYKDICSVKEK